MNQRIIFYMIFLVSSANLHAQETITVIPENAEWAYFKGRSEPTPNEDGSPTLDWTQTGFDDADWERDQAGFGYSDNDDTTVFDDMRDNYRSVYIRKSFSFTGRAGETHLKELRSGERIFDLIVNYDDGFVAYLNGVEIARSGLSEDPPAFDDGATSHEASGNEFFQVRIDLSNILEETNILAIQGHNTSLGSSDFTLSPALQSRPAPPPGDFRILVFTRTEGFRHGSISAGLNALRALSEQHQFEMETTENPNDFNDGNLSRFDAVVFLNTTGDVLDRVHELAFERYIQAGGGFAGVHSATDTEYNWPWYGELVGAYFRNHPQIQNATVHVEDRTHVSTSHLPADWIRRDEWYNFRENPRGKVHILATLDEGTYNGGSMGNDHPIAWCHFHDGGRAWYTAGGHTSESFSEPAFRAHLLGGIQFVAGVGGGCGAPPPNLQLPGDGNQDGKFNLGDPVWLLVKLFVGQQEDPCESDADQLTLLDHNNDQLIDMSDAIANLQHLFLGGPPHIQGQSCIAIDSCGDGCGEPVE